MSDPLFERLQATNKLPTPPGVVLRLLELTRREDVSVREIADTIAMDPGLAAKIVRFANSPMAGMTREITSLPHAVALLGVRGVKMMALSFAALTPDATGSCRGFDQKQFSIQSLGCGIAARILATATKTTSSQEAFLAGLFSQIGRTVLAAGMPDEYTRVLQEAQQVPRDLPPLEKAAFGETYATIGAQLLRTWGIPEALCSAIETFREIDREDKPPAITRVLYVAELAAGMICPDAKSEPPDSQAFVEAVSTHFGIDNERCADIMSEIAAEIENTRGLLDLPKGKMRSPEEIETEVRERIAELSLAMHLENQNMAQQQEDLMRRATTDALTGIGNRAAFDARMLLELERSARSSSPFALLMIDVDRFKAFNDTHGHQAGDRVLQGVARLLDQNVRKIDYAARYGGEEFAVIAPDTTEEGSLILAERLRQAVEAMPLRWEGKTLRVTISVGVAVFHEITSGEEAATVIKAADEQLYAAKCAGRNQTKLSVKEAPLQAAPCGD
jgi:diguanylate cyclase (GGDEF)-like protein